MYLRKPSEPDDKAGYSGPQHRHHATSPLVGSRIVPQVVV